MNEDWIKFLQFAIKEDVEQPDSVEDIDWESLFLFMRKQSLGGVLMYGVNKLKGVKIPRPVLMKIFMFSEKVRKRNEILFRKSAEIAAGCLHDGFPCCILKGQGNTLLYKKVFCFFKESAVCQEPSDGVTDTPQTKVLSPYLTEWHPLTGGRIVGSLRLGIRLRLTEIEHVERMDFHARIAIDVRNGEEVAATGYHESRLLTYFSQHPLLARLVHIDETTRQVERPLGRLLSPPHNQKFHLSALTSADDKGGGSRRRIGIVGKAAVGTMLALHIVLSPVCTPATRTIAEDV